MASKDQSDNSLPRWMRRLMLMMVLLACALVAFAIDQYLARRRFDAAVAARRARGEPVLPADFELAAIPDNENAAFFIRRAAEAIRLTDEEETLLEHYTEPWACPSAPDTDRVARIIARQPEVFSDFARAQQCQKVAWSVKWAADPLDTSFPQLKNGNLVLLLSAAIRSRHILHNDAAAIAQMQALLFLGDATDQEGMLVAHLVAMRTRSTACQKACEVSLDLDGSTRQSIRAIIATLLDESAEPGRTRQALLAERTQMALSLKHFETRIPWASRWFDRAAADVFDQMDPAPEAFFAPDFPTAKTGLPSPAPVTVTPATFCTAGGVIAFRDSFLYRVCATHFRYTTKRRVAAAALAIRLYALDHQGQLPARLEDLVPAYLPQVPKDPFAAGGKPLNYRSSPRPLIYSVGEDGVDNGGADKPRQSDGTYSEWHSRDAVFYLRPGGPP